MIKLINYEWQQICNYRSRMEEKINQLRKLQIKTEELYQTNALGNNLSLHLYKIINNDILDLHDKIFKGAFIDIREWWQVNVQKFGAKYYTQDIIHKITYSVIKPNPYMNYNYQKYSGIYD